MGEWLAGAMGSIGAGAAVLDLSNRLFGSYRRTAWGVAWRAAVCVLVGGLLAAALTLGLTAGAGRSLWTWAAAVAGVAAVIHLFHPSRHGTRKLRVPTCVENRRRIAPGLDAVQCELALQALPQELAGLRLLLLSDLHCGSSAALERIGQVADAAAAWEPDIVAILGDLGERRRFLPDVVRYLAGVPARLGAFCVRGNHDFGGGRGTLIAQMLADTPIRLLDNRVWTGEGFSLVGTEAPWNEAELPSAPGEGFRIALSHTPDNLFALDRLGVDLVVSGHTHGGRLHVPALGPLLVPSRYGSLLARGAFRFGGTTLYVTAGLGYFAGTLWGRAEVAQVVLRTAT